MSGTKITVIGGGTGLSILLRGVKSVTEDITAIVSVADDGGGSGILREDLGMLPPGDIRACILALANTEPILEDLITYRFSEGMLKGQNFGNLMIAAMVGISKSFEEAIEKISSVFAITGKVLPVTTQSIKLIATLKNGMRVTGESIIPMCVIEGKSPIQTIEISPSAIAYPESLEEIMSADVVVLGPGSLYTSIIPNLLVDGVCEALKNTQAQVVYISNIMTQPGETDGYSTGDHLRALLNHMPENVVDYIMVSNGEVEEVIKEKYRSENAHMVQLTEEDQKFFEDINVGVITGDYTEVKKGYLRHNAVKLSEDVVSLVQTKVYRKS